MTRSRLVFGIVLAITCSAATAQLYRWTDEKGRTHITDTPPPTSAKGVQKTKPSSTAAEPGQAPFELTQAMREFPVTLYTAPSCQQACANARAALNKRAVPFREIQVWDEATIEELKKVAGANEVPVLVVGRSVHKGYEQTAFDALLDSARYPKAGSLPPRAQAVPPKPEGYSPPSAQVPAKAEPVKPEAEAPAAAGPYAPGAARQPKK